jgi:hypothetical protein
MGPWLEEGRGCVGGGPVSIPPGRSVLSLWLCVRRPPTSARHRRCFVLLACRWKTRKKKKSSEITNKPPRGGVQQAAPVRTTTRQNTADLKPPNRTHTPSTGGLPPRCVAITTPTTSRDKRAGEAPLIPRRAPGAPKWARRRPRNGTQEIAKRFWSHFYGGLSQFCV